MAPRREASAAAHAASKKRGSAFEVSHTHEERIRSVLEVCTQRSFLFLSTCIRRKQCPYNFLNIFIQGLELKSIEDFGNEIKDTSEEFLIDVYLSLIDRGFSPSQIEGALSALPVQNITLNSTLDWLLLHLDGSELPSKFAASSRPRGLIEVRQHPPQPDPQQKVEERAKMQSVTVEERERMLHIEKMELLERKAQIKEHNRLKEVQAEKERQEQRAWILQYAPCSTSDDDTTTESSLHSSSTIEDWELWGTADEIEKKRAEKSRQKMSLDDRVALIARELALAKNEALSAKMARDKNRQKASGQEIGRLKRELETLGINEEHLPAADVELPHLPCPAAQLSMNEEYEDRARTEDAAGVPDNKIEEPLVSFDLFAHSDDVTEMKPQRRRLPIREKGAIERPPKAVLQQHCQSSGAPGPKFERLVHGGHRDGRGGFRYSVVLEPLKTQRAIKAKQHQGLNRNACRIYTLPPELDGWERIEDAQNAAATVALCDLCGYDEDLIQNTLSALPYVFQELWVELEVSGYVQRLRETPEVVEQAELFVHHLLETSAAEKANSLGTSKMYSPQENNLDLDSWSERLLAILQRRKVLPKHTDGSENKKMADELVRFRNSEEGQKWATLRSQLPVNAIRAELLQALEHHDVVVVSGETGSGKTTQVPQYILESATDLGSGAQCSIVVTQPRRIAAMSVAERVADERGESLPGRIGYHVRLDAATTRDTKMLFCTTGILLRRLSGDPALAEVTHVIVDEVHERTLQGDFLMALLKDLLPVRRRAGRPLKVILMSATLDSNLFADYFAPIFPDGHAVPLLHAQGRTFPVQTLFLEDSMKEVGYLLAPDSRAALRYNNKAVEAQRRKQQQLVQTAGGRNVDAVRAGWGDDESDGQALNPFYDSELYREYPANVKKSLARLDESAIDYDLLDQLIAMIDSTQGTGAVLVFLPGMGEISTLADILENARKPLWIVRLHSTSPLSEQRKAFKAPPQGLRKVVLATNIAETSLTIKDVVFVVDSGKLKERRHDPSRGMSLLVEDWVSIASSQQRKGRAGRVRPGMYYALYTRDRFEHKMRKYQLPEMQRVPLEELVLQIHLLKVEKTAKSFLSKVLQPPPEKMVEGAVITLQKIGALTPDESLTPLGHHIAQLPVDGRIGKLLIIAASLGCLAPALTIAACLSHKSPFQNSQLLTSNDTQVSGAMKALASANSNTIAAGQQSDHLVMAAAVDGWMQCPNKTARNAYTKKYCLNDQTVALIADMRGQFAAMLADIGFLEKGKKGTINSWWDDPSTPTNKYSTKPAVIKAALLAALYPNIAVMSDGSDNGQKPKWHDGSGGVAIHPGSVNSTVETQQFTRPFLLYLEKVRTRKVFLRDCTTVSPMALLLFGGALEVAHESNTVLVDGWVKVRAPAQTAVLVKKLRGALDAQLKEKVNNPKLVLSMGKGGEIISSIVDLLEHEEKSLHL